MSNDDGIQQSDESPPDGDGRSSIEQLKQRVGIYRLNAHDWWLAINLQEAIADAATSMGLNSEDIVDELHPPYRLNELASWTMTVKTGHEVLTFKEAMNRYLEAGGAVPARFATT